MPDSTDHPAITALRELFEKELPLASTPQALKGLNDQFLSRNSGSVTALLKSIATQPHEQRRDFGQAVNALKVEIESAIETRRAALESSRPPAGAVDITLPARSIPIGRVH